MPIYEFECDHCGAGSVKDFSVDEAPGLGEIRGPCHCQMGVARRVLSLPNVITQGDPDDIPLKHRVTENTAYGDTSKVAARKMRRYNRDLERKRIAVRRGGNKRPGLQMTHSIPTELFHGKIKQTGDKNYWDDAANRNKHKDWKV